MSKSQVLFRATPRLRLCTRLKLKLGSALQSLQPAVQDVSRSQSEQTADSWRRVSELFALRMGSLRGQLASFYSGAHSANADVERKQPRATVDDRAEPRMSNITDATCDYGLAQVYEDGCVRTLSSFNPDAYLHVQIIYLVLGSVTTVASGVMYIRSIKYEASTLQQYNFLFCCYASLTMVLSGADPKSYGHIIPRPISSFLSDSLTAALYSVYILTLGYWATIIHRGAAMGERPQHLACLEGIAIGVVWVFYILYNVCLFMSKGFNRTGLTYLHLMWSAIMLGIISTVFLIYGLRVLSRLQAYEREKKLRMPMPSERMMNHSYNMNMNTLSDDEDGVPVMHEPKFTSRGKPKDGHSAKIRKILYVIETLSLIVVAAQMYMAVSHTANESDELQCANGIGCEAVKANLSYLNVLQVICVWVVLWAFRTIKKKEVIPQPQTYSLA